MTDARTTILGKIDSVLGRPNDDAETISTAARDLIKAPDQYQPDFSEKDNLARFIEKATSERVTASVAKIEQLNDVPGEVAAYLAKNGLASRIALQPRRAVVDLDWQGINIHHVPTPNEPIAVSVADHAIAETGSVVFLSAEDAPTLMNFLPLHHIVIVDAALIFRYLEDVFTFVGERQSSQPRNINIVTGTSGTADIEAKNIRGAHGPRFMHLIVVSTKPNEAYSTGF